MRMTVTTRNGDHEVVVVTVTTDRRRRRRMRARPGGADVGPRPGGATRTTRVSRKPTTAGSSPDPDASRRRRAATQPRQHGRLRIYDSESPWAAAYSALKKGSSHDLYSRMIAQSRQSSSRSMLAPPDNRRISSGQGLPLPHGQPPRLVSPQLEHRLKHVYRLDGGGPQVHADNLKQGYFKALRPQWPDVLRPRR